jgi:hypothetical protein
MRSLSEVEKGSGNAFADIGLPNPEERLAKTYAIAQNPPRQLARTMIVLSLPQSLQR